MGRAIIRGLSSVAICAVVAMGFQNCAQSNNPPTSTASSSSSAPNGPIGSTYPSARYSTSVADTWQYSGESITFTVPAGANQSYRLSMREMGYSTVAGMFIVSLSTSSTGLVGTPAGIGVPYQSLNAGAWSTVSTEGYVELPPGVYTYYVWVYNGTSGTMQLANASSDNAAYCIVMAWLQ